MATVVPAPKLIVATTKKLADIRTFLRTEGGLVGRDTEVHRTQVALAGELHVILHGKPGVAKSMTVDSLLRHIPDLSKFKTQAYKASPPEQFLGPISFQGMTEDRFVRIISRKIADVEIAVVDELPRAPRAVLPAFQGMMVEREFDAGDGVMPVPLKTFIGTSNHELTDEELAAFLDRFALKLVVEPPQSQAQFVEILKGVLQRRRDGKPDIPDELIVGRDEWEAFKAHVKQVHVPDEILETFGELWANLLGAGVEPSVRRYGDTTAAMQACAALDGRDECVIDDLQIAQDALWTFTEEIPTVRTEVLKFASEWVKAKAELIDSFAETLDRLGQIQSLIAGGAEPTSKATIKEGSEEDRREVERSITDHGIKVVNEWRELEGLLKRHIDAATGQDTTELEAAVAQLNGGREWVFDRLLGGLRF